jgi:hypothetical protein
LASCFYSSVTTILSFSSRNYSTSINNKRSNNNNCFESSKFLYTYTYADFYCIRNDDYDSALIMISSIIYKVHFNRYVCILKSTFRPSTSSIVMKHRTQTCEWAKELCSVALECQHIHTHICNVFFFLSRVLLSLRLDLSGK